LRNSLQHCTKEEGEDYMKQSVFEFNTLISLAALFLSIVNMHRSSVQERIKILQDLSQLYNTFRYKKPEKSIDNISRLQTELLGLSAEAKANRAFKSFFCPIKYEADEFVKASQMLLDTDNLDLYDNVLDKAGLFIGALIDFLK